MAIVNPFVRPRDFEALKSERARLESFSQSPGFPTPYIKPEDCANAGFFFLQDGDKVQCAFCRGVAGEWEVGDSPMIEHQRHFPRCPFVCGLPVGNVPLDGEAGPNSSTNTQTPQTRGVDVCGLYNPPNLNQLTSIVSDQHLPGGNGNIEVVTSTSLGIQSCGNGPAHQRFVTLPARIKTYADWPKGDDVQNPENLAKAGFFYMGRKDHVKCFYCDGGLRNWEASDDPWLEHARWFPNCTFVILNKGDGYISEVKKSKESSSSKNQKEMVLTSQHNGVKRCGSVGSDDSGILSDEGNSQGSSSTNSSSSSNGNAKESKQCKGNDDIEKDDNLEEQIRNLKEQTQCKICMDNQVGIVFLPCGHLVSCTNCATALSKCALCRQPIKALVRTYLS